MRLVANFGSCLLHAPMRRRLCLVAAALVDVKKPVAQGHEFNEFLTFNSHRTQTSTISMIRSYLKEYHKILLPHGGFHSRDIMVLTHPHDLVEDDALPKEPGSTTTGSANHSTTRVTITSILDWEMCG